MQQFYDRGLPFELVYGVTDADECVDAYVQLKGDPAKPGDSVPRHFLTVLGGAKLADEAVGSGRKELAEWILADDNPLTARVMVNRIWLYHFGKGIVPTPNDFGKQGKLPTHPELLDYLAGQFRDRGWSIKEMHRLIMLSRTYQQSTIRPVTAIEVDPNNELLAGYPRRRLDAESIRDTLLMLGGELDLTRPGEHPFPKQHAWSFTQHNPFKAVYESNHRSVYLMTQRIQRHPYLAIFDGADPSTSTPQRTTSTTPLQALYLLNDPLVHRQAERLTQVVLKSKQTTSDRIEYLFEQLFSRLPNGSERLAAEQYLTRAEAQLGSTSKRGSRWFVRYSV